MFRGSFRILTGIRHAITRQSPIKLTSTVSTLTSSSLTEDRTLGLDLCGNRSWKPTETTANSSFPGDRTRKKVPP